MAEDKPAPVNPWEGVLLLVLIIGGCFLLLWQQGRLKDLNIKSLFVQPPVNFHATTSETTAYTQNSGSYASQQLQHTYTVDPHPLQVASPTSSTSPY